MAKLPEPLKQIAWTMCIVVALGMTGCVSLPPSNAAAQTPEGSATAAPVMIRGRAEVWDIQQSEWTITADGRPMASGPATIWLKITEPAQYRDPHRGIGVYDMRELQIGSHLLTPGDVISFEAEEVVFLRSRLPDVLSNLKHIEIVKAASGPPVPAINK